MLAQIEQIVRPDVRAFGLESLVRIECERCGRAGSYRRDSLMARVDIALPDLLVALSSCQRWKDFSQPCGVRYTDLAVAAG